MSISPRILLVDDDENDLRMIASAFVTAEDASALFAVHDGAEALDYLHARGTFHERAAGLPELILLDLNMPRINGWEVLRQVKGDSRLRRIPVVIFSSSARDTDVMQSYDLGANAYVVKPINFELFRQSIRAIEEFWLHSNHAGPNPERREDRTADHLLPPIAGNS